MLGGRRPPARSDVPRFDPTEFGRLRTRLKPQDLRQALGMVSSGVRAYRSCPGDRHLRRGERAGRMPVSQHIDTINALIGRIHVVMRTFLRCSALAGC